MPRAPSPRHQNIAMIGPDGSGQAAHTGNSIPAAHGSFVGGVIVLALKQIDIRYDAALHESGRGNQQKLAS